MKNLKNLAALALLLTATATFSLPAVAEEPVNTAFGSDIAMRGIDTVSYHEIGRVPQGSPLDGVETFSVQYKGVTWRFASAASAARFKATPDAFAPAYNGFCSNALALGEGLIPTSGKVWEIFDDRLHVFYAPRGRTRWLDGNHARYREEADRAWRSILAGG